MDFTYGVCSMYALTMGLYTFYIFHVYFERVADIPIFS
jgi:hypothetical protein